MVRKQIGYTILVGENIRSLADRVRESIENGWECTGGVAVTDCDVCYQAMVLYADQETK